MSSLLPFKIEAESPIPPEDLLAKMQAAATPSLAYYLLLICSSGLATLGLIADSAAVIIGAMIIAPLMNPIVAFSYGLARANRDLTIGSAFSIGTGIFVVILVSMGITEIINYHFLGKEILSRTNPSLIDLGIAIFAGLAGAISWSRKRIANALPGVAIAVALVPPLCVTGIGISIGEDSLSLLDAGSQAFAHHTSIELGSFLLFVTNVTAMVCCGTIVFLLQGYGRWVSAGRALGASLFLLLLVAIPLVFSFHQMMVRSTVAGALREMSPSFPDWELAELRRMEIKKQRGGYLVRLFVDSAPGIIGPEDAMAMEQEMSRQLDAIAEVHIVLMNFKVITSDRDLPESIE